MGKLYVLILLASALVAASVGHLRSPAGIAPTSASRQDEVALVEEADPGADQPAPMQVMADDGSVELNRNPDGHFYADVDINGTQVHMLVDTGASGIALTREDAASAGIASSIGMNDVIGRGADGDVHGEYVMLERVMLGPKIVGQVPAVILGSGEQSLLGQAFLRQFGSVQIVGDTMRLQ